MQVSVLLLNQKSGRNEGIGVIITTSYIILADL